VIIEDSRVARQTTSYTLRGPIANIYELCSDRPTSVRQIQPKVGSEFTAGDIADALDDLVKRGLVVSEGDTYLSLAFPAGAQL
jgi:hypothetical protein